MGAHPEEPAAALPGWPWFRSQPRRWQAEALPIAMEAVSSRRRAVISAVMGSGKSILIRAIAASWLQDKANAALGPIVVTTPTVRLVEQLADTLGEAFSVGRFYTHAKDADAPVIVCCNASALQLATALAGRRVGLWIADEAHRSESERLIEAAEKLQPEARIAVTATPYRSEQDERISLFDETIYRYTPADALRENVIVRWKILGWTGQPTNLDDACVQMIRDHGRGPGIVNASKIDDAEAFAARLNREGITAKAVHSRMSPADQAAAIEDLRTGRINVVVHVALLVEGVDYPWLRWACLRRMVGARVRFVQEVGRVLRASPGKTEAVLLDPNGLFEDFNLTFDDALGWVEPVKEADEEKGDAEAEESEEKDAPERRAVARNAVRAWSRQLALALSSEWVADLQTASASWKNLPPSPAQIATLRGAAGRHAKYLPDEHAATVRALMQADVVLTRGVASDLLGVLFALGKRREHWVPAVEVQVPSAAQIAAAAVEIPGEDTDWSYAGIVTKTGAVAIVVLRGQRVVQTIARDRGPSDQFFRVEAEAAALARRLAPVSTPIQKSETAKRMAFAAANRHLRSRP